jgi:DNA (cytosine-5)-methyltransferase 1
MQDVVKFSNADVVIGGPPCQGFSPLNMCGVGLERRELWSKYLRVLEQSGAQAFVMEDGPGGLIHRQLRHDREYCDRDHL